MTASENLHRIWRMGGVPTPREICDTITSTAELAAFREGLKMRGALTGDAVAAIADRAAQIGGRKG